MRRWRIERSTALVTGASSGIGEATARRLAREPGAELILVARREERLRALADSLPCEASWVAADLTDPEAPERVRAHVAERGRPPDPARQQRRRLLARRTSPRAGYANVERHMELNFDAVLRLTEALLPVLRESTPSAIVNVASTAGRVARARTGAYSASKFALIGWTDALYLEERPHGVHVGLVLPGFIATEGFPATELRQKALTRWMVSKPEAVAEAIVEAGPRRQGGALRAASLRAGGGRCASSLRASSAGSSPAGGCRPHHQHRGGSGATERPHWKRARLPGGSSGSGRRS